MRHQLKSLAQARAEAELAAQEIVEDALESGQLVTVEALEIEDEHGKALAVIPFKSIA